MYLEIFDSQDSWTLTTFVSMHHLPPAPLPRRRRKGKGAKAKRSSDIYPRTTPNPLRVCIQAVCSRPASHPRGFSHSGIRLVGFLLASGCPVLRLGTRRATKFLVHPPWNSPSGITRPNHHLLLLLLQNRGRSCGIRHSLDPQLFRFHAHRSQGKRRPWWTFDLSYGISCDITILFRSVVTSLGDRRMMFKVGFFSR